MTARARWKWWHYNEMLALCDIWGESEICGDVENKVKNTKIYDKISDLLKRRGVMRNPSQVREKMKTLKRAYLTYAATKPKPTVQSNKLRLFHKLDSILNREDGPHSPNGNEPFSAEKKPPMRQRRPPIKFQDEDSPDTKHRTVQKTGQKMLLCKQEDGPPKMIPLRPFMAIENEEDMQDEVDGQSDQDSDGPPLIPLMVGTNMDEDEITIESVIPGHVSPLNFDTDDDLGDFASSPDGDLKRQGGPGLSVEFIAERMMDRFLDAQAEMEKKFLALEEKRMKEESRLAEKQQQLDADFMTRIVEIEERKRQDDKEHQDKLCAILAALVKQQEQESKDKDAGGSSEEESASKRAKTTWEISGVFNPVTPNSQATPSSLPKFSEMPKS